MVIIVKGSIFYKESHKLFLLLFQVSGDINIISRCKIVEVRGGVSLKHNKRECGREESKVVLLFVVRISDTSFKSSGDLVWFRPCIVVLK